MDRKEFLVKAGGAVVGLGIGGVALVTIISPNLLADHTPRWTRVGPVQEFPAGGTREALVRIERDDHSQPLRERLLYVRREANDDWIAFSRNCTDLSCPVAWDVGSDTFLCPCHGGIFDREGVPIAGPPNKPLYRYAHRIQDGYFEVDLNSVPPLV
jgi:menaquinol-cytochrome c reductase iron-sulfur subunit